MGSHATITDTPNPLVVPGFSLIEELENFVAAGITPDEALVAATREAARFVGELREWGTIEPGRRADLVLLLRLR
jgi:imidazolonepropionase-like amidohydrolase